jgi:hypothetical protein
MPKKYYQLLLIIMSIALISFSYSSYSKGKKSRQEKKEGVFNGVKQQKFEVTINYDSLMTVITDITSRIAADPSNIGLRKSLVSACYDSSIDRIIAPGRGKPAQNAPTPSIAREFAVRAAKIEAFRWAYAINQWHQDPSQPMSEILDVDIPPALVVAQKTLSDSSVQVLVVLIAQKMN